MTSTKTPKARPLEPPSYLQRKEEEEEEEEELVPPVPDPIPHPPKQQSLTKPKARPTKPIPTSRPSASTSIYTVESAPPPMDHVPSSAPSSKQRKATQKSQKRKEPESPDRQSDPEVEVLTFGKPTKRAKDSTASATILPPQAPTSFALPGTSDSGFFQPPPAPTPAPASKLSKGNQNPSMSIGADEDSEEEWEEVANADSPPRALSYHSDEGDIGDVLFDDDGDANFEDELANQLNAELGGDFLEAALSEPQTPVAKMPLSWDQLAATTGNSDGIVEDDSDDDFSSSDDSDDD